MTRTLSTLCSIGLSTLLAAFACAQNPAVSAPSIPAASPSEELLRQWRYVLGKIVTMAEDFPGEQYGFKAQKDQRTFAENLIHIAAAESNMMNAVKGTPVKAFETEDSLKKIYTTKDGIVKLMKEVAAGGEQLIKEQGDAGLLKEYKYPWANVMVHGSFLWYSILEHSGEHYGQLVVYYRINGMIPPESRPRKR